MQYRFLHDLAFNTLNLNIAGGVHDDS